MSDVRATIGKDVNLRGEREPLHLQVIQHNPSKCIVQLEYLVYKATEKATGHSGKVVDEPAPNHCIRVLDVAGFIYTRMHLKRSSVGSVGESVGSPSSLLRSQKWH
jgi:hypothetical protein